MRENEYTPNAFARGLGLGTMKTVGIICPDISNIYMEKAVSYLEDGLHEYGYDCILGCSGYDQKDKENYVKLLLSKKIDTLVLVGSTYAGSGKDDFDTEYIREAAAQTPVFMINAKVTGENIYCAYADNFQATYEAALRDANYPINGNLKFKTKNDIEYTKNMLLEYNRVLDFDSEL